MKNLAKPRTFFLIFIMLFLKIDFLKGQTSERFVYCWGNDSIVIEKISETISGDTIIKEFSHSGIFNPPPNVELKYYHFNDSTFIKYNGEFYMIGADSAEVGDVWNPIRFGNFSYIDTALFCPKTMNLEVESIDTIIVNGIPTKYFTLKDLDSEYPQSYTDIWKYKYIEKTGATSGGIYYSFIHTSCGMYFDFSMPTFKFYEIDSFVFEEISECPDLGVSAMHDEKNRSFKIYPNPVKENITFKLIGFNNYESFFILSIYDVTGKLKMKRDIIILKNNEIKFNVNELESGFYLIEIVSNDIRLTSKFIKN